MTATIDQLISAVTDYHAEKMFNPWPESCRMELDKQYYPQRRANLKALLCCVLYCVYLKAKIPE